MRKIFQNAAADGGCMYWGYGVRDVDMEQVVAHMRETSQLSDMHVCVEQHMADHIPDQHAMLQKLKMRTRTEAAVFATRLAARRQTETTTQRSG